MVLTKAQLTLCGTVNRASGVPPLGLVLSDTLLALLLLRGSGQAVQSPPRCPSHLDVPSSHPNSVIWHVTYGPPSWAGWILLPALTPQRPSFPVSSCMCPSLGYRQAERNLAVRALSMQSSDSYRHLRSPVAPLRPHPHPVSALPSAGLDANGGSRSSSVYPDTEGSQPASPPVAA